MDPSAFIPQRTLALVEEQRSKDLNARNKLGMDVQDSHKTKISTGIARIGCIASMQDITSLCINICAVLSAITSSTGPEPILRTIMTMISQLTLNRDWDDWIEACGGQMPTCTSTSIHLSTGYGLSWPPEQPMSATSTW